MGFNFFAQKNPFNSVFFISFLKYYHILQISHTRTNRLLHLATNLGCFASVSILGQLPKECLINRKIVVKADVLFSSAAVAFGRHLVRQNGTPALFLFCRIRNQIWASLGSDIRSAGQSFVLQDPKRGLLPCCLFQFLGPFIFTGPDPFPLSAKPELLHPFVPFLWRPSFL